MTTAPPSQPAELEEALRKLARRAPLTPGERALVQRTLDETPPAAADDWTDVTPEEMAELEEEAARAEDELRAGRCIPVERVFAERGIA